MKEKQRICYIIHLKHTKINAIQAKTNLLLIKQPRMNDAKIYHRFIQINWARLLRAAILLLKLKFVSCWENQTNICPAKKKERKKKTTKNLINLFNKK